MGAADLDLAASRGQRRRARRPLPAPTGPASPSTATTLPPPAMTFDHFYQTHRDEVARTLALTLGDDALGYEAADEAMSRAYERWGSVGAYANPEGWVYRTGLNWARSWLRRRRVGAAKTDLLAARSRSDQTDDQPGDADLAAAIARLPHRQRAVVVLRYYRDWSVEQTADALAIAPGTVKSRLSRALTALEQELTEQPREGGRS
ncbi:MAG: SigE family RNA polymerase sigma factor [Actinomycetota bacterium]